MKLFETAAERVVGQFKSAKQRFAMTTRPYYSTGAFRFDRIAEFTDAGGLERMVFKAPAGQQIIFFSYGLEDTVQGFGLGNRSANDSDTNMAERTNTNNEDFVVEGMSSNSRGIRVKYDDGEDITTPDPELTEALANGTFAIEDPGSQITPPETQSPFLLEDLPYRAIRTSTSLRIEWNRKDGDYIGTLDELPEGGGNSYLKSNGEPSATNFWRLPEGYIWRREGAPRDTILTLRARLELPVFLFVTVPTLWESEFTVNAEALINIWVTYKIKLHGKAFFVPSENI